MTRLISFRYMQTRVFAVWTALLTLFFAVLVVLGHEGDPPNDPDPAMVPAAYSTSFSTSYGGGHSTAHWSSRGLGFSFGK